MAKYAKPKEKKKRRWGFLIFSILYALVFLGATAYGLDVLWDVMDAFEVSRVDNTLSAYMDTLTPEKVCEGSSDLIASLDHHIQSEEQAKEIIKNAVSGGFSYARKSKECTETRHVYVLRSGGKVIGQVTLEQQGEEKFGFTPWVVTGDSFDMSYLRTGTVSTTTPDVLQVYVNGALLDESYRTGNAQQYSLLKPFYDDFDLPHIVSYTAGPCLGAISLEVRDADGNPVTLDENTDMNQFLYNCSETELAELDDFMKVFIKRYVAFSTSRNENRIQNYNALAEYMVKGSDLQQRAKNALDGLQWGQSKSDVIVSITANHVIRFTEDTYMVDVTYEVDSTGRQGVVRVTNNAQILVKRTEKGLLAESLLSY